MLPRSAIFRAVTELLDSLWIHDEELGYQIFLSCPLPQYQHLRAADASYIDLHRLSEGSACLALRHWLSTTVAKQLERPPPPPGGRSGREQMTCIVVTGQGKSRNYWQRSDVRGAAMDLLLDLGLHCTLLPRNPGRLRLLLTPSDLPRLTVLLAALAELECLKPHGHHEHRAAPGTLGEDGEGQPAAPEGEPEAEGKATEPEPAAGGAEMKEEKEGTTKVPLSDASDEEKKEAPDEEEKASEEENFDKATEMAGLQKFKLKGKLRSAQSEDAESASPRCDRDDAAKAPPPDRGPFRRRDAPGRPGRGKVLDRSRRRMDDRELMRLARSVDDEAGPCHTRGPWVREKIHFLG
ncbi:Pentatricopeptide repeat-containing protein [Durusdinium trenchii]|uniref:Chloroplastic n=1 Tax=Durusdinium trenchii TaxID=1381693 RepID=A0ABP0JBU6_9DINO